MDKAPESWEEMKLEIGPETQQLLEMLLELKIEAIRAMLLPPWLLRWHSTSLNLNDFDFTRDGGHDAN